MSRRSCRVEGGSLSDAFWSDLRPFSMRNTLHVYPPPYPPSLIGYDQTEILEVTVPVLALGEKCHGKRVPCDIRLMECKEIK